MRGFIAALGAVVLIAVVPAAQADVQPYATNDAGGFHDVLPPGANGMANGVELAAFLTTGARPAHNDDQLAMYRDLMYATPGLKAEDLGRYYKDSTFGVQPADIASSITPRADVTILRDNSFGIPHVYGTTRGGDHVRRRLRRRRGPPVLHRRPAPPGPRPALLVHRRRAGQPGHGRRAVVDRALHRGRPPAPVRPGRRPLRRPRAPAPGRRAELRRRHQPVHRRGPAEPDQDARRVRRARPAAGTRRVEGDRPHRHRLARRGDLRQGRRARAGRVLAAGRVQGPLRRAEGPHALGAVRRPSTTPTRPTTVQGTRFPYQAKPKKKARARRSCPIRARSRRSSRALAGAAAGGGGGLLPGGNLRRPAPHRRPGSHRCRACRCPSSAPCPRRCPTRCSCRAPTRPAATRWPSSARRSPTSPRRSSWRRTCTGRASTRRASPSRA